MILTIKGIEKKSAQILEASFPTSVKYDRYMQTLVIEKVTEVRHTEDDYKTSWCVQPKENAIFIKFDGHKIYIEDDNFITMEVRS